MSSIVRNVLSVGLILVMINFINPSIVMGGGFSIVSSTPTEVILEYNPPQIRQVVQQLHGLKFIRFQSDSCGFLSEEGKPELPEDGTLVGLPSNSSARIEIVESKFDIRTSDDVLPAPKYRFDENNEAVGVFYRDEQFYNTQTQFYPDQVVQVSEIAQVRNQRVAKITVHPIQYNPATRQLKRLVQLRVRCTFFQENKTSNANWSPTGNDPQFEPLYKNLIINYNDAKQFRGKSLPAKQSLSPDSTRWFVPNRTYYRLPIGQDGLYRLTYSQLDSAGLDLQSVDQNSVAIYNHGSSVPLFLNTSSPDPQQWYIDFYASRNHGTNSDYDLYSDTSCYWLTVNDNIPSRFQETPSAPGNPAYQPLSFVRTAHFEQDIKYYFGYSQDEISTTDAVPGEGWYWADFFPLTTWSYSFAVDSISRVVGGTAALRARFFGMTKTATPSQHTAEVRINGNLLGQVSWSDNTEAPFSVIFPDTLLQNGNNIIKITSFATPSPVNKFYLDWFEVDYNRISRALNNQIEIITPQVSGGSVTQFNMRGFTTDSIDIYDLTNARKITGNTVVGGIVQFQDTASGSTHYIVSARSLRLRVPFVEQKVFRNLRQNNYGADYIIITHRDFIDAAQRLGQARASRDNLRVIVTDVQDIYDEFNFGGLKPDAIRDFLKYPEYNWPQPAATFVVMFGNACLDFKKHLSTTVKKNFVPAFGNPPSDNALVSFDSVQNYLPYMFIGRLPVENALQADRLVTKILNYDDAPLDEWNKQSLFITGGLDSTEQPLFNSYSEDLINNYITSPPVQGTAHRVYKSSSDIIDGDSKLYMQGLINGGINYINFIGHSGGRLWNVDIGSPNDLQNISGKLPFVCSVSCNVGFFSAPNFNVLAEDFLMADNRGAIAVWSASSIGYANVGWRLTGKFLSSATLDFGRSFGQLTTIAQLYFWQINGLTTPLVVQTLQLHPLLGDPYSLFALPLKPDIDVGPADIHLSTDQPTSDSIVSLKVTYRNFGILPHDSILVTLRDAYTDPKGKYLGEGNITSPFLVPPFANIDSINVQWDVRNKPGVHVVKIAFDPQGRIPEIRKNNNTAEKNIYVYKNVITPLAPVFSALVKSGVQQLVVSVPALLDTSQTSFFFELDTVADFISPFKLVSSPVLPGPVSVMWQTPPMSNRQIFYWRCRTWNGSKYGAWTFSSFMTDDLLGTADSVTWKQSSRKQFVFDTLSNLAVTDSGVTLHSSNGLLLYVRSVGNRVYPDSDYYSIIKIGEVTVFGLYFYGANSFIVARIDPLTGIYQAQGYDLRVSSQADSLLSFLQNTPYGFYVALSAVLDAKTNVTEALYQQIEALGSTHIRNVLAGQSWCLLSRKGSGAPLIVPLESYVPSGTAILQYQMPNYYSNGAGTITTPPIGPVHQWVSLTWDSFVPSMLTFSALSVFGMRQDSTIDSLMSIPNTTTFVNLSTINPFVYPRIFLKAHLSNSDGLQTPELNSWSVLYLPPPDEAISPWSVHPNSAILQPGDSLAVNVEVHNIGIRDLDSGKITYTGMPANSSLGERPFGLIASGNVLSVHSSIVPPVSPGTQTLRITVSPVGDNDAFAGNNVVYIPLTIAGGGKAVRESIDVFFDGRHIVNGDYVSPTPVIHVETLSANKRLEGTTTTLKVTLDGKELAPESAPLQISSGSAGGHGSGFLQFRPSLKDGEHILGVSVITSGQTGATINPIRFNVMSVTRLLEPYNYPNPFREGTHFTFLLTGATGPDALEIKIYTIAGRLIRTLAVSESMLHVGFNSVAWDGKDSEGDEIANGTYFAKIRIKTNSSAQETMLKLSKAK